MSWSLANSPRCRRLSALALRSAEASSSTAITFGQVGAGDALVHGIGADGTFTKSALIDFWTKMSTAFKSNATVVAYGLMNEPWAGGSYGNYKDYL